MSSPVGAITAQFERGTAGLHRSHSAAERVLPDPRPAMMNQ